jgi:PknH-like extracellular domain
MRQRMALAVAGFCVLAAACNSNADKASPALSGSTTAAAVAAAALDGLLLSTADINAAIGTSDSTGSGLRMRMNDLTNLVSRPECLPIFGPADGKVYASSGYSAVRHETFSDPRHSHAATQAVVLLPTAPQAAAFFTASSQAWQACANGTFNHNMSGGRDVWEVGPVSNADGVLSTTVRITQDLYDKPATQGPWTAQRVLTVRNNVVIDVFADTSTGDPAALKIAQQIAAKVPG